MRISLIYNKNINSKNNLENKITFKKKKRKKKEQQSIVKC